ncbi:MAG TPA: WHG domain-containing protein, partial [Trebonia sp.]|nr:WHG domain-containing protein [Trebonia sp.]
MTARESENVGPGTGTPRERLLAAALRLLEDEGPEALQARRLATEIGASTMAVYTHFGGMTQLIEAIAYEGFVRLSAREAAVRETADPIADLLRLGIAYHEHAMANPRLYRLMFGVTPVNGIGLPNLDVRTLMVSPAAGAGREAFALLVRHVTRVIEAGSGTGEDPVSVASQFWSSVHGYVLLEIAGFFGAPQRGAREVFLPLTCKLIAGLGHSPQ